MPPQSSIICLHCSTVFRAKPSKARQFCSFACYQAHRAEQRPTAICRECGVSFTPQSPSVLRAGNGKFCSATCLQEHARQRTTREFWDRTTRDETADGCWEYTGTRNEFGYGRVMVKGTMWAAHRFAWELTYGPIPDGLYVCHRCDNPPCCRPDHLFLGTAKDNMQDAVSKGRKPAVSASFGPGEAHPRATLTAELVREIRRLHATGMLQKDIAAHLGVGSSAVYHVVHGQRWGHIT